MASVVSLVWVGGHCSQLRRSWGASWAGQISSSTHVLQEGMLKELQKSVEDEEQVWKAKLSNTEEDLQKVCLEAWLAAQREGIGLPHFLPGLSLYHPVWSRVHQR